MKYVIDSCTAFKWFLDEQESDGARALRDAYRDHIVDLLAPDVFPIEIVHALTRAERQKRITEQEGAELVEDLFSSSTIVASLSSPSTARIRTFFEGSDWCV